METAMPSASSTPSGTGRQPALRSKFPLLVKIERQIESSLPDGIRRDYQAVKVAGLQVMFSDQTHRFMADFLQDLTPQNLPQKVAVGIANVIRIVARESKGKMTAAGAMPAAIVLMLHALDYINRVKQIPITPQTIDAATQAVSAELTKLFGITKAQVDQAAALAMKRAGEQGAGAPNKEAQPPAQKTGGLLSQAGAAEAEPEDVTGEQEGEEEET